MSDEDNNKNVDDNINKNNDKNNKDKHKKRKYGNLQFEDELAIVISATCAIVIAFAINTFLQQITKNYLNRNVLTHFIYVLGIIIIFTMLAYYLNKWVDYEIVL